MAKNWKANELIEEIQNGNKDAIFDAGRRFPIFTTFAAKGNIEGLVEIIKALPDYITVRKIETILKENVQPIEDEEEEEEEPKKKATKAKAKKEEAEEEAELDEETLKAMKIAELRKVAKENKIDIEGLKGKKAVIDAILAGLNPDEEDDDWDEDDDDDEDWDI